MGEPALKYDELESLALALLPREKLRLITRLTRTLEQEYIAQLPEAPGWPPGFFERTYGSLANDPIERPSQGEFEERDPIP
jgi:hypothetical protein